MSENGVSGLGPRQVARVLADIATLMELNGRDPFRTRAFSSAARALEGSDLNLTELARTDRLTSIPGVGPAIAGVIREIVLSGRSALKEELEAATPLGLFDLMRVPGLGPKRIRTLYEELSIDSLDALEAAARAGALGRLAGFGPRTIEKILGGLEFARSARGRRRYPDALAVAVRFLEWLQSREEVLAAEIAGDLRRRVETVDRVALVAASTSPGATIAAFRALNATPSAREGEDVACIELTDGMVASLRCVPPETFVAAMVWETGAAGHLERLVSRAGELGLTLHRDGLSRDGRAVPLTAEDELYGTLGLEYVEPELREGLDEVERAAAGSLPVLVRAEDLTGTFHCHTTYSDGKATVEEMAAAARERGWGYLGIADHSRSAAYAGGLSIERVRAQHAEIDAWNATHGSPGAAGRRRSSGGVRLFKGIESDILPDGTLDYPTEVLATFDYVVGSVHSSFGLSEDAMTERVVRALRNPYLTILGHATGRLLLTRSGYALDLDEVFRVAAERGVVVEINSDPRRLDVGWREARAAGRRGVLVAINPDAHSIAGLDVVAFGLNMARKAGLEKEQVFNCWPLDRIEEYLAERKQTAETRTGA